ncbi:dipeptidase [Acidicapsa dinghuensis]|uniref:Dipeptidase n=1 Tax=Acidicapsa dinghuensis TaxID=2218256 RepID=A0ABW1EET1_9BACT|nr:membrane dipeptidase [Acidicapsa dinghuensis]
MNHDGSSSRRQFLSTAAMTAGAMILRPRGAWAADTLDPRVADIVSKTIGIDTHNHIDVPMTETEMPGPDIDLAGEMKRSGLSAICMTFATDYQKGNAYERFLSAMEAMDRQLKRNNMQRSLSVSEIRAAHKAGTPTVIQAIEGAHFLQGKIERVEEAYRRGMRHFGLLHDSDAEVPLGDVYTNPPRFGGLTEFGASVIKECNRLGMLIDLAHADIHTTQAALKVTTRPVIVSHTGLDTQLGNDPAMAQMMRPRLISKEQAKIVADGGGAIGVWTHLSDTPLQFAQNIRALVDVIGVDHVCIGTDTKLTPPTPRFGGPPPHEMAPGGTGPRGRGGPGPQKARIGERTNEAWADENLGFYYVVVDAMLKTGFNSEEITKIGGGNYLRLFAAAVKN